MREGKRDMYRLARLRDKKMKDLNHVKCIKDEFQRILTENKDIKER